MHTTCQYASMYPKSLQLPVLSCITLHSPMGPNPPYHNMHLNHDRQTHTIRDFLIGPSPEGKSNLQVYCKPSRDPSQAPQARRELRALLQTTHARPAARPKIDETTVGRMVNGEKGGPVEKALYRVTRYYSSAFSSTVVQRETRVSREETLHVDGRRAKGGRGRGFALRLAMGSGCVGGM